MGKHSQMAQRKRVDIADGALKYELEAHAGVRGDVTIFERSLCVSVSVSKADADPEGHQDYRKLGLRPYACGRLGIEVLRGLPDCGAASGP